MTRREHAEEDAILPVSESRDDADSTRRDVQQALADVAAGRTQDQSDIRDRILAELDRS